MARVEKKSAESVRKEQEVGRFVRVIEDILPLYTVDGDLSPFCVAIRERNQPSGQKPAMHFYFGERELSVHYSLFHQDAVRLAHGFEKTGNVGEITVVEGYS